MPSVTKPLAPAPPRPGKHPGAHLSVLVACPDARPPAYEAAAGLAGSGDLGRLVTGFYYRGHGSLSEMARTYAPCQFRRIRRQLLRRHVRRIPGQRVVSVPSFDLALAVENRLDHDPRAQRAAARWRTRHFDRVVARTIANERPEAALIFSDVGSEFALPACRRLGVPSFLSMVHGDVREEAEILAREQAESPDYFPLYLGDGRLDRDALAWLHARRERDIALADRILVPSDHIAARLVEHGTPRDRIGVVPYAADTRRFRPRTDGSPRAGCTFLFAGGITQRKGIKYLLRAWARIRRPGWKLRLLGALPRRLGPLADDLKIEGVEHLGRVGHDEMPARMAEADVFVFPSLFEGSAVVTYEALACGLPSVATAASGTVARDGVEGYLVPSRDVDTLALRMERLGLDPALRARMSLAARRRAEEFDWPRYHASIRAELRRCLGG
ncbi:MAG TPA: glycosyltransferase family 4 protein [Isosphaeraceae bacterium]